MTQDVERDYKELLEWAEAHFAAQVRWSETGRVVPANEKFPTFQERWLMTLAAIRTRELISERRPIERAASA